MAKNCGSLGDTDLDEAQEIEHPSIYSHMGVS